MDMRTPPSLLPLELDQVVFAVGGRRIIDGVSLRLDAGPRTVIVGPNGAGKSVLLRLCHGLLQPTSGTISWTSPEPAGGPRRQAMVFQRPVLLRRTAVANIAHALAIGGVSRAQRRPRALEALRRVGLERLAKHPARVLSGGEQQRLALARAWALSPEVLFLDEPTASLDPVSTLAIEELLLNAQRGGIKIVVVTHDVGQARRLARDIAFLHHGRIVEHQAAKSFFEQPNSDAAQAFLAGGLVF